MALRDLSDPLGKHVAGSTRRRAFALLAVALALFVGVWAPLLAPLSLAAMNPAFEDGHLGVPPVEAQNRATEDGNAVPEAGLSLERGNPELDLERGDSEFDLEDVLLRPLRIHEVPIAARRTPAAVLPGQGPLPILSPD